MAVIWPPLPSIKKVRRQKMIHTWVKELIQTMHLFTHTQGTQSRSLHQTSALEKTSRFGNNFRHLSGNFVKSQRLSIYRILRTRPKQPRSQSTDFTFALLKIQEKCCSDGTSMMYRKTHSSLTCAERPDMSTLTSCWTRTIETIITTTAKSIELTLARAQETAAIATDRVPSATIHLSGTKAASAM